MKHGLSCILAWCVVVGAFARQQMSEEAAARERENRAFVVEAARETIGRLRTVQCGRTNPERELTLVLAFGSNREALKAEALKALHAAGLSTGGEALTRSRLHGAIETEHKDFRVFEDLQAVAGDAVVAHWQDLVATYEQSRLVVLLGDETIPAPSGQTRRAELFKCERADPIAAAATMALWRSPCPTGVQMAKVEDEIANEVLENGVRYAPTLVLDARDGRSSVSEREETIRAFVLSDGASSASYASTTSTTRTERKREDEDTVKKTTTTKTTWGPKFEHALELPSSTTKKPSYAYLQQHQKRKRLIICAGHGASATRSLAEALKRTGLKHVDHYLKAKGKLELATAIERFDFLRAVAEFDAVADTPIPGFWQELLAAVGDEARVVLTVRRDWRRDFGSIVDLTDAGVTQYEWDAARAYRMAYVDGWPPAETSRDRSAGWFPRGASETPLGDIDVIKACGNHTPHTACRDKCHHFVRQARKKGELMEALAYLSGYGDATCRVVRNPLHPALSVTDQYVRPAIERVSHPQRDPDDFPPVAKDGDRVTVYGAICPSAETFFKSFNNINRHILRRVPSDKLLVMDVTRGDAYDLLCPFLDIPPDACPGHAFPNSKQDRAAAAAQQSDEPALEIKSNSRSLRRLSSYFDLVPQSSCVCDIDLFSSSSSS